MKKLLAFILAAVMTASLCACGSSKGGAEGSTSAKGSSAAGEAVAASDIKVGCIMIGDENEGYTEAHLKAVEEMKKNLGLSDDQVVIKTNIKEDEGCYDAAVDLAEQGCNIVIANSFGHESYILQAAADYPDVQFCHATGYQAKSSGLSNMHNFFTRIYESRYLSGVVAGMKLNEMIKNGEVSKDKCKIGYVGAPVVSACWLISTQPSAINCSAHSFSRSKDAQLFVYFTSIVAESQTDFTPR